MTEEILEAESNSTVSTCDKEQARQAIQILLNLDHLENTNDISLWLNKGKMLQTVLRDLWHKDKSGCLMYDCLEELYHKIASSKEKVNPAVWFSLDIVPVQDIHKIVYNILSKPTTNSNSKVESVLGHIVDGLCQCAYLLPNLREWTMALINGLEVHKNFTVLLAVAEKTIVNLLRSLYIPLYRTNIYPIFQQLLYPVPTPQVFYKIIDEIPKLLNAMRAVSDGDKELDYEAHRVLSNTVGLFKTLLIRFPPPPEYENIYSSIRAAMLKCSVDTVFEPELMNLWDMEQNIGSCDWRARPRPASLSFLMLSKGTSVLPRARHRGLMNQGNTCYMNSILQMLYMTPRFRNEVLSEDIDPSNHVLRDLQQLMAMMQESVRCVVVPGKLTESTLPATFLRGHQQDSSEYLIHLLDSLHENESKLLRRNKLQYSGMSTVTSDVDIEKQDLAAGKPERALEQTLVERIFGGVTLTTVECVICKTSCPKTDNIRDLSLSIPEHDKEFDLQDLVNKAFEPETLTNENRYDCSNCRAKQIAVRRLFMVTAPQHLIVTLKIFRFDPVCKQRLKIHKSLHNVSSVRVPVHPADQPPTSIIYDLKGVVLHSGSSLDGGHYFARAVDQDGEWFVFNDSLVTSAEADWNGTPYILLMRQRNICDPPKLSLPSKLQYIVNKDNANYMAESKKSQTTITRKYDDDEPPNGGSLGGPGPYLVF